MITLTHDDAERAIHTIARLYQRPIPPNDYRELFNLLTYGSRPTDDETITDRCHCNQPDEARDHSHQRGDPHVCRDTIDNQQP